MESCLKGSENFTQNIHFKGSETECCAEIVAQDVTINCYPGLHKDGSSKVKLTNVVDYQWESKYYKGQLIAIHINGKVIAYGIKGKVNGMVRVANPETNQRTLIKDIKGLVQDVAFALTPSQIILGFVDEEGNLYIYNIHDTPQSITCSLAVHIIHPNSLYNPKTNYRVIWCPYVPSFEDEADAADDPAKLLVFLNGNTAEIWDIDIINTRYGVGPFQSDQKYEGYAVIDDHRLDVVDASLSPDGTAIATACLDGFVKFFQVYMINSEKPKCLHQWQPHEGKPLSSMFFLDNISGYNSESKFWKFAVTGASNNAELKIWSCESWTCLQKINFTPSPSSTGDLSFKVRLDLSASYLLMSDIHNRILYVLQLQKNDAERHASVSCISELLLPAPFLSFCISSASIGEYKSNSSPEDLYQEGDAEDYDDEGGSVTAVSIKMYVVQPKSLQICNITFQCENSLSKNVYSNPESQPIIMTANGNRSDEEPEHDTPKTDIPNLDDLHTSVSLLIQQQQQNNHLQQSTQPPLNLMSPADFTSPIVNASPNKASNNTPPTTLKSDAKVENLIDFQQPQKDNFASGGSSPSREVQEILSLKNPQEYFDNLSKIETDHTEVLQPSCNNFSQAEQENVKPKEVVWPHIPIMKAADVERIDTERKEDTLRKEHHVPPTLDTCDSKENKITGNDIHMLTYKVAALESAVFEQTNLIRNLLQETKNQTHKCEHVNDIKKIIAVEMDLALNNNLVQLTQLFDNYMKEQKRKDRDLCESLVANVSQNLTKRITEHVHSALARDIENVLQTSIANEIKNVVVPSILATFEKLHIQLEVQYSQKLNTLDLLLKNSISKLASNKAVTDSLSSTIISVIKPSLEQCYKDMISTTLIPSWERVCNSMFQQIHSTFTQGTKEYTSSVENYMERQRKVQDKGKDLIAQMVSISETMKINTEKLNASLTLEIQRQMNSSFLSMQETLIQSLTENIKEQVRNGFKSQAALLEDSVANAVRSRAVTPSPHAIDTQIYTQLDHLIANGNLDSAFQQALSASSSVHDVRFVLYVCEQVNPQDVFGMMQGKTSCILPQNVLLSLIQQLSTDLSRKTDVKMRYLQEAVLALETDNALTKQHMPTVLNGLAASIKHFIAANPTHKSVKNMMLLQMATQYK